MPTGSLPITIGITGHRDIRPEDAPVLERAVAKALGDIAAACPSTPLYVITSLAEGADRLVARVAIAHGAKIVVPLPLRRELYEEDFATAESKKEFADLLAQASDWFELPLLEGATEEKVKAHGADREHQYALVGAYIARYSHAVIALWDGDPHEKIGGTSFVAGFKLRGIPPPYIAAQGRFEPEETGVVYHIMTPRQRHPASDAEPGTTRILYPENSLTTTDFGEKFKRILADTEAFNQDELTVMPTLEDRQAKSKHYLSPALPEGLHNHRTAELTEYFSIADTLAIFFQHRAHKFLRLLFWAAMSATITFEFYAYLATDKPFVLVILFFVLAAAYGFYYYAAKQKYADKFQDYRTIAEGLRVQYYWKLAGIEESVANNYLKEQRSELDWIRHGLRSWSLPYYKKVQSFANLPPLLNRQRWALIIDGWVNDQYKYFAHSTVRENKKLDRLGWLANILLVGGFGIIGVHMAYQFFFTTTPILVALYISSCLPIAAGLLFGYAEKRSLAEHARQYERMASLFAKAKKELETVMESEDFDEARDIVYELGKEALKENGDWVLTHRNRPIEVPLA